MRPDEIKDTDVDAAIDRAVREMMSAEPRADFGRRVRARLERPARVVFTIPRIAAVTALSAAIAIFVLTRDHRPTPPAPRIASHTEPTTRPQSSAPLGPQATAASPTGVTDTQRPRTAASERTDRSEALPDRRVQAASIDVNDLTTGVAAGEPLTPVAPIALSALPAPEPVSKPEIRITPLDVSPIEIAPLITPRRAACEENAC